MRMEPPSLAATPATLWATSHETAPRSAPLPATAAPLPGVRNEFLMRTTDQDGIGREHPRGLPSASGHRRDTGRPSPRLLPLPLGARGEANSGASSAMRRGTLPEIVRKEEAQKIPGPTITSAAGGMVWAWAPAWWAPAWHMRQHTGRRPSRLLSRAAERRFASSAGRSDTLGERWVARSASC